jgi:hypothetical protein
MISHELGMQLHDRWTRGEILAVEEQEQLEAWYEQQDAEETQRLDRLAPIVNHSDLQTQVDVALKQLVTVTQRVEQVTVANEGLRQEILNLRQQLTTRQSA